jgi:hypothetical protein
MLNQASAGGSGDERGIDAGEQTVTSRPTKAPHLRVISGEKK